MIDEARARGLQSMYAAGATGALQPLYEECAGIAYVVALQRVRGMNGNGESFTYEILKSIAHGASTRLIERYLSDPDFHVKHFAKYLDYMVSRELIIPPAQKQKTFEARVIPVPVPVEIPAPAGTFFDVRQDVFLELSQSHPKGKKVVADLCRSRSYHQAIRRIAAYVKRQWIYDNAAALHQVYRTLHRKRPGDNLPGTGLAGVRRRLLQGQRDKQESAVQRVGKDAEG